MRGSEDPQPYSVRDDHVNTAKCFNRPFDEPLAGLWVSRVLDRLSGHVQQEGDSAYALQCHCSPASAFDVFCYLIGGVFALHIVDGHLATLRPEAFRDQCPDASTAGCDEYASPVEAVWHIGKPAGAG